MLLAQAILIGRLADYFVGDLTEEETRNALLYAAGIVICSILSSLIHPHAFVRGQEAGTYNVQLSTVYSLQSHNVNNYMVFIQKNRLFFIPSNYY